MESSLCGADLVSTLLSYAVNISCGHSESLGSQYCSPFLTWWEKGTLVIIYYNPASCLDVYWLLLVLFFFIISFCLCKKQAVRVYRLIKSFVVCAIFVCMYSITAGFEINQKQNKTKKKALRGSMGEKKSHDLPRKWEALNHKWSRGHGGFCRKYAHRSASEGRNVRFLGWA